MELRLSLLHLKKPDNEPFRLECRRNENKIQNPPSNVYLILSFKKTTHFVALGLLIIMTFEFNTRVLREYVRVRFFLLIFDAGRNDRRKPRTIPLKFSNKVSGFRMKFAPSPIHGRYNIVFETFGSGRPVVTTPCKNAAITTHSSFGSRRANRRQRVTFIFSSTLALM